MEHIATTYDQQAKGAERSNYERKCNPGDDQRNSDLCAQWKAADAAADSARWAAVGTWIGGISGLLVLFALGLAFQANRIARKFAEADLRPWIDVEIVSVSMSSSKETFALSVDIRLRNLGRSPALNAQSRARIVTSAGRNNTSASEFFPGEEYTRITHNLMPGGAGDDILHPRLAAERIKMIEIFTGSGAEKRRVGGPHFVPTLEVKVDYQWGDPARSARTVKRFTVSALPPEGWRQEERVAWPISLGEIPVTQLRAFENSLAEVR